MISFVRNKFVSYIALSLFCIIFLITSFNANKIEYLERGIHKQYLFTKDENTPVLVINKSLWKYASLVPYFNDEQIYLFNDAFDDNVANDKYDSIYLVIEKSEFDNVILPNYESESEFIEYGYFTWKKLILK
jgi:hypothetical protein